MRNSSLFTGCALSSCAASKNKNQSILSKTTSWHHADIMLISLTFFPRHTNEQGLRPRFYFCQLGSESLVTPSGGF